MCGTSSPSSTCATAPKRSWPPVTRGSAEEDRVRHRDHLGAAAYLRANPGRAVDHGLVDGDRAADRGRGREGCAAAGAEEGGRAAVDARDVQVDGRVAGAGHVVTALAGVAPAGRGERQVDGRGS